MAVTTVAFSDLNTWLQNQPANTAGTPYEITITGLTTSNYNDIKTILISNGNKYVDLSTTSIPSGVTGMSGTFQNCTSLVNAPVIPNGITNMNSTFYNCTSLVNAPVIPDSVTNMAQTFVDCTSLVNAPVIPDSVTNMSCTFQNCTSLVNAPVIPDGVINMTQTFYNCTSLVNAPVIPDGVTSMSQTFQNCTSLVNAPVIPDGVTNMTQTFQNCTLLINTPVIPNGVTNMFRTFYNCTSLVNALVIPDGVTNMYQTFYNCTSLSYKPIIPSTVSSSVYCYGNVTTPNWKGTQSQVNSFYQTCTEDCEIQIYNDDRVTYKSSIYDISINTLSTYLVTLQTNTTSTPYKIFIRDLTTSNASNIKTALTSNGSKYVDLTITTIPNGTDCSRLFYNCSSLIKSPVLPTDATSLNETFYYCRNLDTPPTIPSTVTNMQRTFDVCENLKTAATIPNGVTNMTGTYAGCSSLTTTPNIPSGVTSLYETFVNYPNITPPTIPNGVINLAYTFYGSKISVAPTIPNTVTNMAYTFWDCENLVTAPVIPEGVTDITGCFGIWSSHTSHLTTVPYIPSTITKANSQNANSAFSNCKNLRTISIFKIPLNTLKNNPDFKDMFENCTSLRSIGLNTTAGDWHVFSLKVAGSNVTGKIYSRDKSSVSIPQTSITKSNIQMPVLTDELWFPPSENEMSDAEVEDTIEDLIDTKYSWYEGTTLDPSGEQFVMYAKDPTKFTSNIDFGGGSANPDVSNATGVLAIAHGGTGQTTAADVVKETIQAGLEDATGDVTDNTDIITSHADGYSSANKKLYRRKAGKLWNYIVSKNGYPEARLAWGGRDFAGDYSPIDSVLNPWLGANRYAGVSGDNVTIEYTRDGGTTWTDYGASAQNKKALFTTSSTFVIGKADSTNKATANGTNYQLRITVDHLNSGSIYSVIKKYMIYVSTNGSSSCTVTIQRATFAAPNTFVDYKTNVSISGWSGWNVLQTDFTVGDNSSTSTSTSKYKKVRFIFKANGGNTSYNGLQILRIYGYGGVGWGTQSTLASQGTIYSTSVDSNGYLDATFPHNITATTFNGTATNAYSINGYLTCTTAAGTAAKTVDLAGFTLVKGAKLIVYLQNANTAQSALTLNVNSTGAKTIRWNGTVTSSSTYAMTATYYNCYYDGTYWNMDSSYEARSARVSGTADLATQADYTRQGALCNTAAGTQAKVANMRGYVLAVGSFPITFPYANTYDGKITLNVNSKGAKDVYINGLISSSSNKTLPAGTYMCFYDGTNYYIDTTYAIPNARTAYKIRTSAPSSPADGDIWME